MSDPAAARLVSMRFLRALVDAAERLGVDRASALREGGVTESELADDAGWIPSAKMTQAWERIPELSGDPCFGLHAAEHTTLGVYGPLDLAVMSSPHVGEALSRMVRYYRSMGAMSDIRWVREPSGSVRITARPIVRVTTDLRHYFEHMFALAVTRIRLAASLRAGAEVDIAIRFAHEAPASEEHAKETARIFGSRVAYGAKASELFVGAATNALPLRTANPELSNLLEREAARLSLRPDAPIVDRVRSAIEHGLREGDVGLDAIAKKLALGARTVQRLLQRDGTSYADVLDGVRREVALKSVAEGKPALGELSYTLGFAQPSAFYRAFKRWTGCSPAEWRAKRDA